MKGGVEYEVHSFIVASTELSFFSVFFKIIAHVDSVKHICEDSYNSTNR